MQIGTPSIGFIVPRSRAPGADRAKWSLGAVLARPWWLQHRRDIKALAALDHRLARDIAVPVNTDVTATCFLVDPRPLWNLGLVPRPLNEAAPWQPTMRG